MSPVKVLENFIPFCSVQFQRPVDVCFSYHFNTQCTIVQLVDTTVSDKKRERLNKYVPLRWWPTDPCIEWNHFFTNKIGTFFHMNIIRHFSFVYICNCNLWFFSPQHSFSFAQENYQYDCNSGISLEFSFNQGNPKNRDKDQSERLIFGRGKSFSSIF